MPKPMKRKAVGFYWTLPVPWAGFTQLPPEIDEAAKASRTIAYERQVIRSHAEEHGFELIYEAAFLEIEPDRGSELVWQSLDKIADHCREHDATLLLVEFSMVQGWRSHGPMTQWAERASIRVELIYPSETVLEGKLFDPHEHFQTWKKDHGEWIKAKPRREAEAWRQFTCLRDKGCTFPEIAQQLNAAGVRSPTGKIWTKDNLIKFASKYAAQHGSEPA